MKSLRPIVAVASLLLVWAAIVSAQVAQPQADTHVRQQRPKAAAVKKETPLPSIIQSELERSRAEEKQMKQVQPPPVQQQAPPAPAWPLFVSLGFGLAVTVGLLVYFLVVKRRKTAEATRSAAAPMEYAAPAAPIPQPAAPYPMREETNDYQGAADEDAAVMSSSPYVNDDDTEMPEAALTMNLLNKKRETKKELILEVMKRVQRKEKPQHIAEALRIGIGEVHLAMTLAKLKK